ncbi:MAG: DUF4270 family protein [Ferruginibacter sp.]
MFRIFKQNTLRLACALVIGLASCEKIDIAFEDNGIEDDPDVVQIDNQKVEIGTVKQDTFNTASSEYIMVGTHRDAYFGKISTSTYAEISLPESNPILNKSVRLDSICLILNPTGNYVGDTTLPFTVKVHELTENIKNSTATDAYYNLRSFAFNPANLAQATQTIKPTLKKQWLIRLPDALGNDWLQKLNTNADEIQSQERFRGYFKGLLFETDSNSNNTAYYFKGDSNNVVIRMYYKELGLFHEDKTLDFSFATAKSFFHYDYNYTGTLLGQVQPQRKQYLSSASTGNKAFLYTGTPAQIKFSFPDILTLKERFPDLKVVKAVLEIRPLAGSYHYPARLPSQLVLNETTSDNYTGSYVYESDGTTLQYGNLVYDPLNNVNTKYSFTITSFINSLIEEGQFSTKALLLNAYVNTLQETAQLVINDQSIQQDVKLKLYVLGL